MLDAKGYLEEYSFPTGLSPAEMDAVYYVEVLGMPAGLSARRAGLHPSDMSKPHMVQAREIVKKEVRGNLNITKEDATAGIKDAIDRARILAEPMTEIAGWDRLIKLHGLDAPQKIDINVNTTIRVVQDKIKGMSDEDLMKQLGADRVIDAEFYRVEKEE